MAAIIAIYVHARELDIRLAKRFSLFSHQNIHASNNMVICFLIKIIKREQKKIPLFNGCMHQKHDVSQYIIMSCNNILICDVHHHYILLIYIYTYVYILCI